MKERTEGEHNIAVFCILRRILGHGSALSKNLRDIIKNTKGITISKSAPNERQDCREIE